VRGAWNEELLRILEGFPDLAHDDEVNPAAEPWKCSLPRYFRRDHWREVLNQCHTLTGSKTRSGEIPDRQARENRSRHLPNLTKPQIVTACPSRRSKQNHNGKSGPSGSKRPIGRSAGNPR